MRDPVNILDSIKLHEISIEEAKSKKSLIDV